MSDGTRINGYGGYSGFSRQQGRTASLVRFRKGRRPGDIVSGVFARFENETMGWALLEGEELLAALPADGPRPEAGSTVYFRVEALTPEVVLRMLSPADPAVETALAAGQLPLAQHAALYASARDRLDTLLRRDLWPDAFAPGALIARKEAFAAFVASGQEALDTYVEGLLRARMLCRAAAASGLVYFRHLPWLCPAVSRLEIALRNGGDTPVRAGGMLRDGTAVLVRGRLENAVFRYRVDYVGYTPGPGYICAPEGEESVPGASLLCLGVAKVARLEDVVGHILVEAAGSDGARSYSRKL